MQQFTVQKNKCLSPMNVIAVGNYSGTLSYSATGSNYVNISTDISATNEELINYFCLVRTNGTIGVYANLINVAGAIAIQVRTDYRDNETANTVDVDIAVLKIN